MSTDGLFGLTEDWSGIHYGDKLAIYGVGRIGRRVLPSLIEQFEIPFLIDNSCCGTEVCGKRVLSLGDAMPKIKKDNLKVVVTTMKGAYNEISASLKERGLAENKEFCVFERFAQEWNLRWQDRCVLAKIDTVITSRCSLKCKNCNIFVPHINNRQDIDFAELKQNFDIFFDSVDYVYEYTLLGGEPFVHKDIIGIIDYLGMEYRSRIGGINLISNGTVMPSKELVGCLKKNKVTVHISDYTKAVAYSEKLENVTRCFEEAGIAYYVIPNNTWKDIVYPRMTYQTEDAKTHMLACGHSTHSVGDGKLYWCDVAYAAEKFLGFPSKADDYLDLEENRRNHTKYESALNILKYFLGDVNGKGYMSLCEKCAGIGSDNDVIVKAGEQAGKHDNRGVNAGIHR